MSLKEILLDDMKTAMKEKNKIMKDTIQLVRSAVLQVEKDNKITLDDNGIIEVIAKELKKRRDALSEYENTNRDDIVQQVKQEIEVLLKYLPAQLSESEIRKIILDTIEELGEQSKNIGMVMKAVMPKFKGRADGKTVNALVKEIIS